MNDKKVLFLLLLLLPKMSCDNPGNYRKEYLKNVDKKYQEIKTNFSDLIEHFPAKLDTNYLYDRWTIDPMEEFSLELGYKFSADKYETLFHMYENRISEYNTTDTCLLILNRYNTKDNYQYIKLSDIDTNLISRDCYFGLFPIPNFSTSIFYSEETDCHLPPDFNIIVLDSKPGEFLEIEKLTKGIFMPVEWKNGFSRGVAISKMKQVIIYWTIIW